MSLKIQLKRKTNFKSILRNDSKILRRNPPDFDLYYRNTEHEPG